MTEVQNASPGTTWGTMRVMLAPGALLVSREGPAILVADPATPGQDATVDGLLELSAAATRTAGEQTAPALVRSAAALLATAAPDDVPPLAMVTVDGNGLVVTLTAGMRMAITDAAGAIEVVDAEHSMLPVNRVVRDARQVSIAIDPSTLDADRRSNLSGGVVRAGGLLLVPGGHAFPVVDEQQHETHVDLAPAPPLDPPLEPPLEPLPLLEVPGEPPAAFEVFSLVQEMDDEVAAPPAPVAVAVAVEPEPDAPAAEAMVRGILCSRGHFNPPDARFCERCGISTVHQTHNVITGARPPLGVLVVDDGSVHSLITDYVIGRDPESADDVRAGRASALLLEDPELSLSRVHARLVLDGWEVRVEDAGSANGTFLADAGSQEWRRLEAELPTTITPGVRLRMGSRVLTFESHHRV